MTDDTRNEEPNAEDSRNTANAESGPASGSDDTSGEQPTARERMSAGLNRGMEALAGLRGSLEETIHEARERGDLSADRAKEMMKDVAGRARAATSEARDRFDFVTQGEFDELAMRVAALEARVAERLGGGTDKGEDA